MNYNEVFEKDINRKFFYSDYPGKKMMVGCINLQNALDRLNMDEYYVLVTYNEGEVLPEHYVPINDLSAEDGTLFATINPNVKQLYHICRDGGIQRISRLTNLESGSPNFLLGPGPETVSLEELYMAEYNSYMKKGRNR